MIPKTKKLIAYSILFSAYTLIAIESINAIKKDSYVVTKINNFSDRVEYVVESDNIWKFDKNQYTAIDYYNNGLFTLKQKNIDSTNAPNKTEIENAVKHYLKSK